MWDSAGLERYRALIPSYVRGASIIFIIYDVSTKETFHNLGTWITFIKQVNTDNSMIILCGNKVDLTTREVQSYEGQQFAQKEGLSFFEVSAKTGENVKLMFYTAVADLPTFAEGASNKDNLIKELQEENGVENVQEGNNPNEPEMQASNGLQVNNQTSKKKPKKGCGC